jgi:HD-GYP domain-containing protein (c-di-GMP phosphodiesterase class II)
LREGDLIQVGNLVLRVARLERAPVAGWDGSSGALGGEAAAQETWDESLKTVACAAERGAGVEPGGRIRTEQRRWIGQTVTSLSQTIELRDPYMAGHSERVTRYALLLADALGVPPLIRDQIESGGRLHDIGKIGVSDSVLQKKGRLSPQEYEQLKAHAANGAAILAAIPDLAPIVPIVRHHHKRWDGRGYPDGLSGTDIPLGARILAVADSFDAMTSDRPYRAALSIEEACSEIEQGAGGQFDPELSRAFLLLKARLARMLRPSSLRAVALRPDLLGAPARFEPQYLSV